MTLLITEDEVATLGLTIQTAVEVMESTFLSIGNGTSENPSRTRMSFDNGFMQFGPSAIHDKRIAGFKLWANFGQGKGVKKAAGYGHTYLYDMDSGELLAIVQAGIIGKMRTGAVTGVAVKYLSPENASTIGLYGGGTIAEGQLEAACAVRPIKTVWVYTRSAEGREDFCKRMASRVKAELRPAQTPEELPRNAEIVITATTAETPILFGDWLTKPGLVVAAGANHGHKREVDGNVLKRADLVVTDDLAQSKIESGNLIWAEEHDVIDWKQVHELGSVVAGKVKLPDFKTSNIFCGSHGLSITQVTIAAKAYELALAQGVGTQITL